MYCTSGRSFNNRSDCRNRGCHAGKFSCSFRFQPFNSEALDKSKENRIDLLKTLSDHYGISVNNSFEGQVTSAIPVVNPVHSASELEDFKEAFGDGINFLNEKLKKSAK